MAQVIWQQAFSKKWCVHSPFPFPHGHDVCAEMSGAVGVLKDGNDYFLFARVNGASKQWKLTSGSFDIPIAIFVLKIQISNLSMGVDINFNIEVDGCIDTSIVGIPVKQCVKLFGFPVHIHRITAEEIAAYEPKELKMQNSAVEYFSSWTAV